MALALPAPIAPKFPERCIDARGPPAASRARASDGSVILQFAVFRDADPAELREVLLDPRRLGRIPQRRWGSYKYGNDIRGWGHDDRMVDRCGDEPYHGVDLSEALARATSPCLYCWNDERGAGRNTIEDDECLECGRPLRPTGLETIIAFMLSGDRLTAAMCLSTNGSESETPVRLPANEGMFRGIVTCCDGHDPEIVDLNECDGKDCARCECASRKAAREHNFGAFLDLPRSKGLVPVEELIGTHRTVVFGALVELSIAPAIAGLMTDYHCQALNAPDPIEDPTAITARDIAEEERADRKREEYRKEEKFREISDKIAAAKGTPFALKVMRQSLLDDDGEDLGKDRVENLIMAIDRRLGFLAYTRKILAATRK